MSGFLFLGFAFCVIQLVVIQVFQSPTLASEGERVRTAVSEIGAKRGEILDVNGVVLADSVQAYHIAVNQKAITTYEHKDDNGNVVGRGPAEAAKQLSPLLGISQAELGGMMLGDSTYVYLKRMSMRSPIAKSASSTLPVLNGKRSLTGPIPMAIQPDRSSVPSTLKETASQAWRPISIISCREPPEKRLTRSLPTVR